jgi:hypothetical protein
MMIAQESLRPPGAAAPAVCRSGSRRSARPERRCRVEPDQAGPGLGQQVVNGMRGCPQIFRGNVAKQGASFPARARAAAR